MRLHDRRGAGMGGPKGGSDDDDEDDDECDDYDDDDYDDDDNDDYVDDDDDDMYDNDVYDDAKDGGGQVSRGSAKNELKQKGKYYTERREDCLNEFALSICLFVLLHSL